MTGQPVAVFQRVDQAGFRLPIDERILADSYTILVFGLDHLQSGEQATAEEVAAITKWLEREGTCLLLAPHHDVGYGRALFQALAVPVHNIWGLCPAQVKGTKETAPLTTVRDFDKPGLLKDVNALSFRATRCRFPPRLVFRLRLPLLKADYSKDTERIDRSWSLMLTVLALVIQPQIRMFAADQVQAGLKAVAPELVI